MAVLRAINYKSEGKMREKESFVYITNIKKRNSCDAIIWSGSRDYLKFAELNRKIHGKGSCKRWNKDLIVSLQQTWSENPSDRNRLENQLYDVARSTGKYFLDKGYLSVAAVHCNTAHPHFHLSVNTCNYHTGKQLSQSKGDLRSLKKLVTEFLLKAGISESVLGSADEMSEALLMIDEERGLEENSLDEKQEYFEWNSGTGGTANPQETMKCWLRYSGVNQNEDVKPWNVEIAELIDAPQKVELAELVDAPQKVELAELIDAPQKVELVELVDAPQKVELVELVDAPRRWNSLINS